MRVAEIMNRQPAVAAPDAPVDQIIRRMADERLSAIIVVDAGRPVGVISMTDVIVRNANLHFPRYIQLFDSVLFLQDTRKYEDEVRRFLAVTARDLMTPNPVTVRDDADVSDAATILFERRFTMLPVVDRAGDLVGSLDRYAIVRLLAG